MKAALTFALMMCMATVVNAHEIYSRYVYLMGSDFQITVIAHSQDEANRYINLAVKEISRIESMISSWDSTSQTSSVNRNAGINAVRIDRELLDLINRSKSISKLTDGAFDISYASMDRIWKFDGSICPMPGASIVTTSVDRVGFEKVILNPNTSTCFLQEEGMKIGFGAIGKGYAADKAKQLLIKYGVESGIINAGGDMTTWGKQPNGEEWTVGIKNPLNKEVVFATLPVVDGAIVTSGNYEKYVMIEGERYSHIIDPRTGYPSKGIASVSVLASKAELADALATAVFVMGTDIGIDRIEQLPGIECIVIEDNGKVITSSGIQLEELEQ